MLINKIQEDMKQAMRDKEKAKLSTLRLLFAKIEKEKIASKTAEISEMTDAKVEEVIGKNIKELNKEIESYVAVNRSVESQELEKELLLSYLPKQFSEDEIRAEVLHAVGLVKNGEIKNPMQYLSKKLKGKADMGLVMRITKEISN